MLIQPKLKLEDLITCVDQRYKLNTRELIFLPLGADFNTAVYKLTTHDNINYFLKLRSGEFNHGSVTIPTCLRNIGVTQVISPILTQDNKLYTGFKNYQIILYVVHP